MTDVYKRQLLGGGQCARPPDGRLRVGQHHRDGAAVRRAPHEDRAGGTGATRGAVPARGDGALLRAFRSEMCIRDRYIGGILSVAPPIKQVTSLTTGFTEAINNVRCSPDDSLFFSQFESIKTVSIRNTNPNILVFIVLII